MRNYFQLNSGNNPFDLGSKHIFNHYKNNEKKFAISRALRS